MTRLNGPENNLASREDDAGRVPTPQALKRLRNEIGKGTYGLDISTRSKEWDVSSDERYLGKYAGKITTLHRQLGGLIGALDTLVMDIPRYGKCTLSRTFSDVWGDTFTIGIRGGGYMVSMGPDFNDPRVRTTMADPPIATVEQIMAGLRKNPQD